VSLETNVSDFSFMHAAQRTLRLKRRKALEASDRLPRADANRFGETGAERMQQAE
jgi:hypothetical protein